MQKFLYYLQKFTLKGIFGYGGAYYMLVYIGPENFFFKMT
jgi:hypothetical protein